MQIRFIGDVHGKWGTYKKRIKDVERSLQVGDFGVGFRNPMTDKPYSNPPYDQMKKGQHYFIRGNHDNPGACARHPFWIRDGGSAFGRNDIFCVGGALSIDKDRRTEGYDWWHDEELTYGQLCKLLDAYELVKPSIVVSHECPESVIGLICHQQGKYKYDIPSVTRSCFDNFLEVHRPDLWIHGHWHLSSHVIYKGVEVISLGELEYVDLDL